MTTSAKQKTILWLAVYKQGVDGTPTACMLVVGILQRTRDYLVRNDHHSRGAELFLSLGSVIGKVLIEDQYQK